MHYEIKFLHNNNLYSIIMKIYFLVLLSLLLFSCSNASDGRMADLENRIEQVESDSQNKIDDLQNTVDELESKVNALEDKVSDLEDELEFDRLNRY